MEETSYVERYYTDKFYVDELEYLRTKDPLKRCPLFSEMVNWGLRSTPLLEVFSVRVHANLFALLGRSCEIYGTIKVTNGLGQAFDLYNRDQDNPEFITLDNTSCIFLSLTGPKDGVIIPYECVTVTMDLRDRARDDTVIAQEELKLFNYIENSLFTQEHGLKSVLGEAGFVISLHYATFPYAVIATVDVLFFSKDDDFDLLTEDNDYADYDYTDYGDGGCENDVVSDVYGNVTAYNTTSSVLLNMPHDRCVRVKSRTLIELSRSVMAVSVFYPLQIHVDFKYNDGSRLADGVIEFQPDDDSLIKKDIVGENGRIRVRVNWRDAYEQRYRGRGSDLKRTMEEVSLLEREDSKTEELVKRKRLHADAQPSLASSDWLQPSRVLKEKQEHWWGKPVQLVEVFSIGIGSNDLKPPVKLYGEVRVEGGGFLNLFIRDKSSPQICFDKLEVKFSYSRGILPINDFGIYVDLKDVEGNVFIRGQVSWVYRMLKPWYDKRICTLVRGDHGYVALHYTFFYDGVQARVKVLVKRVNSVLNLTTKIFGSLVARYSGHEYLTSYDKKYYQSVLFESDSEDPVDLTKDGSLPLSKSLVSMPRMSSLIIEADLIVDDNLLPQPGVGVEALQGSMEFNADGGEASKEIRGQNYWIDVLVTWPKVW